MHNFSLIDIAMNNGLSYSIQSELEPNVVIKLIENQKKNSLITIKGLNGYLVLNKNKMVGIDVKSILMNK